MAEPHFVSLIDDDTPLRMAFAGLFAPFSGVALQQRLAELGADAPVVMKPVVMKKIDIPFLVAHG